MAVSGNPHDDPLARDPRLARLMQAAGDEEPPAALDAAILAAARREVSARPQGLDGGGEAAVPTTSARRNWYVPVSIAAVLVLSVSLVTLVHEEKGDELARPTSASAPPAAAPAPQPSQETASVPTAPAAESAADNVVSKAKEGVGQSLPKAGVEADASRKQTVPQSPESEMTAKTAKAAAKAEAAPAERTRATEDRSAPAVAAAPPTSPSPPTTAASPSISAPSPASPAPSVAAAGAAGPVAPSSPTAPARIRERRADPFPSAGDRDGPAASAREPTRRFEMEEATPNYSAVPQAAPAAPSPRPVPAPEQAPRAMAPPPSVQGRLPESAPPAVVEDRILKRGAMQAPARPAWLIELDRQPPEKWLERLAEFKRDGRNGDAEVLFTEFRRRFPDHPASAR